MSEVYLGYVTIGKIEYCICDDGAFAEQYFEDEYDEDHGMEVILPEYVMFEGKKYDVLSTYDEFFLQMDDYPQYAYIEKMYFPKTINFINTYAFSRMTLKHFEIDKDNPYFYFKDDTIYFKENNEKIIKLHMVKKWEWEE